MLYIARHGQTPWNAVDKICGRTDIGLTSLGEDQARMLGGKIAEKGLVFSRVISSPLKRAKDTALIALQNAGKENANTSVEIDERLIEINFGEMEGIYRLDESYLAIKRQFAVCYPGGESNLQVAHRVYALLDELKAEHFKREQEGLPEQDILLVCHGGICRVTHTYFESTTNEEFFSYSAENAELYSYRWN